MNNDKRTPMTIYNELQDLKEQKKELDATINALKAELETKIPPDGMKDGIVRTVVTRTATSWKEVVSLAAEKLIPKTKLPELEVIKQHCTHDGKSYSSFRLAK